MWDGVLCGNLQRFFNLFSVLLRPGHFVMTSAVLKASIRTGIGEYCLIIRAWSIVSVLLLTHKAQTKASADESVIWVYGCVWERSTVFVWSTPPAKTRQIPEAGTAYLGPVSGSASICDSIPVEMGRTILLNLVTWKPTFLVHPSHETRVREYPMKFFT